MLEVDNILTDNSGYNYLLDNKTIVNSLETSDNKFELNKLYNQANYTMFETNGSTKTSQYSISNGKISIEFVATAETSGNYVISLIKQWLVQVKFKITTDIGFDYPTVLSHEYNHALRTSNINDINDKFILQSGFNYDHLTPSYKKYLSQPTEIEARGTQLKNYFNSDVITPDMLKYAAKHYVHDTNMDNNMYQFFSGIKDWNMAAQYLSKYSLKNGGKL